MVWSDKYQQSGIQGQGHEEDIRLGQMLQQVLSRVSKAAYPNSWTSLWVNEDVRSRRKSIPGVYGSRCLDTATDNLLQTCTK